MNSLQTLFTPSAIEPTRSAQGLGRRSVGLLAGAFLLLTTLGMAACSSGGESAAETPAPAATEPAQAAPTETAVPAAVEPAAPAQAAAPAAEVARPEVVAEGAASALAPTDRNSMYTTMPTMTIDTGKFY